VEGDSCRMACGRQGLLAVANLVTGSQQLPATTRMQDIMQCHRLTDPGHMSVVCIRQQVMRHRLHSPTWAPLAVNVECV
jgi:hypothetical protein